MEQQPLQTTIESCTLNTFMNEILQDVTQNHIMFLSEGGHGKSTSLRTIVQHCKNHGENITFKIFDNSLAWNQITPTKYIQTVTSEKILGRQIINLEDCTYEVGELDQDGQRAFISTLIKQDYQQRYAIERDSPEKMKQLPTIVYVIEESNISFESNSVRRNDPFTEPLKKFISIGRNLKMRGIFVAQAAVGEISTHLRRRTRKIYGKIISESDLAPIRRSNKDIAEYLTEIPRFHFIYHGSYGFTNPVKIPDTCTNTPIEPPLTKVTENTAQTHSIPWRWLALGAGILLLVLWLLS